MLFQSKYNQISDPDLLEVSKLVFKEKVQETFKEKTPVYYKRTIIKVVSVILLQYRQTDPYRTVWCFMWYYKQMSITNQCGKNFYQLSIWKKKTRCFLQL